MQSILSHPLSPHPLSGPKEMLLTSNGNDSLLSDAGLVLVAVLKLIVELNSNVNMSRAMQT